MRTTLTMLACFFGAVVGHGCIPIWGDDCAYYGSCNYFGDPGDGDGDGDLGGSSGDGDGDTGGTGGGDGDGTGGTSPATCDDLDCSDDTPHCDEEEIACVECLESEHCVEATASLCDSGTCASCTEDLDCSHVTDLNACDTESGVCVECTDSSDCGGNPCNPITHTCSAYGTNRRACETCDADENCQTANHYCVPMEYNGTGREEGYCLNLKQAPDCVEPFTTLLSGRITLSGIAGSNYCGVNEDNVTCEAVRALLDNATCPSGEDSECPESGICRDIGGTLSNRCTYHCSVASDCPAAGAGSTCGDEPNNFCGFVP